MGFGKRKEKENKNESKRSETIKKDNEKNINKNNSTNSDTVDIDNCCSAFNNNVKHKVGKQNRAVNFRKKLGKSKGSNILLFGQTKEEKLELFINNIKIMNPNMPDFWLQKEIDKFKKKFNM